MIDGIVGYNLQGGHYTSQLRIHTSLEVPMNAEIEASDIVSFNYFHKWERVSIIVKYTSHLNPQFQVKIYGAKLSFVQTFILRTCICLRSTRLVYVLFINIVPINLSVINCKHTFHDYVILYTCFRFN